MQGLDTHLWPGSARRKISIKNEAAPHRSPLDLPGHKCLTFQFRRRVREFSSYAKFCCFIRRNKITSTNIAGVFFRAQAHGVCHPFEPLAIYIRESIKE